MIFLPLLIALIPKVIIEILEAGGGAPQLLVNGVPAEAACSYCSELHALTLRTPALTPADRLEVRFGGPVRLLPTEYTRSLGAGMAGTARAFVPERLTYLANVMNHKAGAFYRRQGASDIEPAFELREPEGAALMFCRHCLRYSLGWCPRYGHGKSPFREPYYLVSADGRRFRLAFDCENCQMIVYADEKK